MTINGITSVGPPRGAHDSKAMGETANGMSVARSFIAVCPIDWLSIRDWDISKLTKG